MFSIAKKYNLWVCQPSFDKSGKNAHTINIHKPGNLLRFTNFVEEGVPLFSKEALTNFMKEYTRPVYNYMYARDLDNLIVNTLDIKNNQRKMAVIDSIIAKNPKVTEKRIYNLKKKKQREWHLQLYNDIYLFIDKVFNKHNISLNHKPKTYGVIKLR